MLRCEDLVIGNDIDRSARLFNCDFGRSPTGRVSDADRRRRGLGRRNDLIKKYRSRACRLETEHARCAAGPIQFPVLLIAFPVSCDVPRVTDRQYMQSRSIAELIDDLESSGLLALQAIGIDRIYDRNRRFLLQLPD